MRFYTSVGVIGNHVIENGYKDGVRFTKRTEYHPTVFVPSSKQDTEFRTIHGVSVEPIQPGTIRDTREFIQKYSDVDGFEIHGNIGWNYAYIAERYPNKTVDYDASLVKIGFLDIECQSDKGFPNPEKAEYPITAITLMHDGRYYSWGTKKYTGTKTTYFQCKDEYELLQRFLNHWSGAELDIVTGWNVQFFDIVYIINRVINILGEKEAQRISPWGKIGARTTTIMGKQQQVYEIMGLAVLDYLELYKKFSFNPLENYKLNTVAYEELGEEKIDYSEFQDLNELYEKNFDKFLDYNIHDVALIVRLDQKLKMIELVLAVAYIAKSNYTDVFTQVRLWDILLYNEYLRNGIVCPPKMNSHKSEAFMGAYVKEPVPGFYDWLVSFDLNSLYPNLIIQYNISPETYVGGKTVPNLITVDEFVSRTKDEEIHENMEFAKEKDVCVSANGRLFRRTIKGIFPLLMQRMLDSRKEHKRLQLDSEQELENLKKENKPTIEVEKKIASHKAFQMATKLVANSGYGAIGNQHFRYFDVHMAEAVTSGGQLSIKWIERKLNDYINRICKTTNEGYVTYSDTDSLFVTFHRLVEMVYQDKERQPSKMEIVKMLDQFCETKIQRILDSGFEELSSLVNAYEQRMKMKREKISDKGIWTAKKRYIVNVWNKEGVQYDKPKIGVTGLELLKSSTPEICRDALTKCVEIIMNENINNLRKYVVEFRNEFMAAKIEDIASPRGVSDIEKYEDTKNVFSKGTPLHVKGALVYNRLRKDKNATKMQPIYNGDKIKYLYLKERNPFYGSNCIAFIDSLPLQFGAHEYVDKEVQFTKTFIDPLNIILNVIRWELEEKSTLEDFFG